MLAVLFSVLTPTGMLPPLVSIISEYTRARIALVCWQPQTADYVTQLYNPLTKTWECCPSKAPSIRHGIVQTVNNSGSMMILIREAYVADNTVIRHTLDMGTLTWNRTVCSYAPTEVPIFTAGSSEYTHIHGPDRGIDTKFLRQYSSYHIGMVSFNDYLHTIGGSIDDGRRDELEDPPITDNRNRQKCLCKRLSTSKQVPGLTPLPYQMNNVSCCIYRSIVVIAGGTKTNNKKTIPMGESIQILSVDDTLYMSYRDNDSIIICLRYDEKQLSWTLIGPPQSENALTMYKCHEYVVAAV
jgi:hypothetical protein